MLKVTRSRRVAGLKPSDYDHEIVTEDHEVFTPSETSRDVSRVSTTAGLLQHQGRGNQESSGRRTDDDADNDDDIQIAVQGKELTWLYPGLKHTQSDLLYQKRHHTTSTEKPLA